MNENITELLDEEICQELHLMSGLQFGSEEKEAAIDDLVALYKLRIEEEKIAASNEEMKLKAEMDEKRLVQENEAQIVTDEINRKRFADEKLSWKIRIGIDAASLILPLIFYAYWMRVGLKFEETGTFTSTTFRGLFNRFRPTK